MKTINQQLLTGERALFKARDMKILNSVFENGESPLKESHNIELEDNIFRWKYPLWYSDNIRAKKIILLETARSGIWYTHDIEIIDSMIQAPKNFRRSYNIRLDNVQLPNAIETFWNCEDIQLKDVVANGDYFAMNSKNIIVTDFSLSGNYAFDGCKNVEIDNTKIISKDAFWNCKNVTVSNSTIVGEYLGWNSKNIRFVNCIIESEQGMCYMNDVKLVDCTLIHTDLAFEYSTVKATINSKIDSVKNPYQGKIIAKDFGEIILNDPEIEKSQTEYIKKEEITDVL